MTGDFDLDVLRGAAAGADRGIGERIGDRDDLAGRRTRGCLTGQRLCLTPFRPRTPRRGRFTFQGPRRADPGAEPDRRADLVLIHGTTCP